MYFSRIVVALSYDTSTQQFLFDEISVRKDITHLRLKFVLTREEKQTFSSAIDVRGKLSQHWETNLLFSEGQIRR